MEIYEGVPIYSGKSISVSLFTISGVSLFTNSSGPPFTNTTINSKISVSIFPSLNNLSVNCFIGTLNPEKYIILMIIDIINKNTKPPIIYFVIPLDLSLIWSLLISLTIL